MEKENDPPEKKKRRLSLSLNKPKTRFGSVSSAELEDMAQFKMPKNSAQASKWAIKNLADWAEEYNRRNPDNPCPAEILSSSCDSKELLNKWLCVFVSETRSKSGQPYSPKSIYALLCGILRQMRAENPKYPNFLENSDPEFSSFSRTLDNLFKSLRSKGVGATASATASVSAEEEELLWSSGVLNTKNPKGLLRATFFVIGKSFCLRGGQEHRQLKLSQLERLHDPDRYVYYEHASKNKQRGTRQLRLDHKRVSIVANKAAKERCPVFILDTYIGMLPEEAKKNDLFYCRAIQNVAKDGPWYSAVPIGRNILQNMFRTICEEAGVSGRKSNHSLRVLGATTLFAAGVPERVIQARTGHASLDALRKYERVSKKQDEAVSKILTGTSENYSEAVMQDPSTSSSVVAKSDSTGVSAGASVVYKDCGEHVFFTCTTISTTSVSSILPILLPITLPVV